MSSGNRWYPSGWMGLKAGQAHIKVDTEPQFIGAVVTTTTWIHESKVDLPEEGEVRYGDKAYSGAKTKGYDASMKRAARGDPLVISDILRNRRISKKRSPVERCFSVVKTVFKAGHVRVTTIDKVAVKVMFSAIGYNLYNLYGLVNKETG